MDFSAPGSRDAVDSALAFLSKAATIVWDGDSLARDSFTNFLVLASEARPEAIQFVAFIKGNSQRRFFSSWENPSKRFKMRIRVVLCRDNLRWSELGITAMRKSHVHTVLACGGGPAVAEEFNSISGSPRAVRLGSPVEASMLTYVVLDIPRFLNGEEEHTPLLHQLS
jgi:hypothetical protein